MKDLETQINFTENLKGEVDSAIITNTQEITDDFLKRQEQMRHWSKHNVAGEYHEVAAIPQILVDKWRKEGFDVFQEPAKAIVARLKAEHMTAFLSSVKQL